jgi:2-keto-4-pentenoate hydratase/2-oxohepta-3-ene-1,7-dioic acid hydratase in catechol pathway
MTFAEAGRVRVGVVDGEEVIDVTEGAPDLASATMIDVISGGQAALDRLAALSRKPVPRFPWRAVRVLAPVPEPRKFLGIGGNFESHLAEVAPLGIGRPKHQTWFNKQTSCIVGPFDDIVAPAVSKAMDYEGELAIVIGKRCRHVTREQAPSVVAGYTVCNDVSARDWQLRSPTAMLGKSFDTHGPLGPFLVTPDEVGDPQQLRLRTWVNDELRQDSTTAEMIYDCWEQIVELSTVFTLEPGDILATGTPAGVGAAHVPPRYLTPGDVVRIALERVGTIENEVVAE